MKLESKDLCPLNGFGECRKLDCAWFINIRGRDPNTGKDVDEWACSMSWMPLLMIENSMESRQTAAAVESFRNEVCKEQGAIRPIAPFNADMKEISG